MKKLIRKAAVLLLGIPLVILGIILIPLPGPGILVSFFGLFILALEFEWAAKHRDRLYVQVKKTIQKARERADKIANDDK
jgi:uncharacterized protein (TIGR02611 family)